MPIERSLGPHRGKAPKPSSLHTLADPNNRVQIHGAASRRKNIYLPNAKGPNALWNKRRIHTDLIKCAVANSSESIKAAANKEYTQLTYESLSAEDQALWTEIARLVQRVEETFLLLTPQARKKKVTQEFSILHQNTVEAFNIVPMTINFIPRHGTTPAHADFVTTKPSLHDTFKVWLQRKHPVAYDQLLGSLVGYCNYLWAGPSEEEGEQGDRGADKEDAQSDSSGEGDDSDYDQNASLPPVTEVRDGIRIFDGIDKPRNVHKNRKVYRACFQDRFRRRGHTGKNVEWASIEREREKFIVESDIPTRHDGIPLPLKSANTSSKADLDGWLPFFAKHQRGDIPWSKGFIFKPTASVAAADAVADEGEDAPPPQQQPPTAPASEKDPLPPTNTAADTPSEDKRHHREADLPTNSTELAATTTTYAAINAEQAEFSRRQADIHAYMETLAGKEQIEKLLRWSKEWEEDEEVVATVEARERAPKAVIAKDNTGENIEKLVPAKKTGGKGEKGKEPVETEPVCRPSRHKRKAVDEEVDGDSIEVKTEVPPKRRRA